jgi:hypothetical protein
MIPEHGTRVSQQRAKDLGCMKSVDAISLLKDDPQCREKLLLKVLAIPILRTLLSCARDIAR